MNDQQQNHGNQAEEEDVIGSSSLQSKAGLSKTRRATTLKKMQK